MGRGWTKRIGQAALLLFTSWLAGCATLSPSPLRENFEPLFLYSEDEPKEGKATDLLGPFFTYRQDEQGKELAFRPFFYYKEEGQTTLLEYLYPLGKYERNEREVRSYLMPFFRNERDLTKGAEDKKERTFLLAFWGETDKGESYGGFFPIYGNLKKRFGRDELSFFLWPIYSDSREGENKTTTVLWPIFSYTHGGGREGFKVWPLFGRERKENEYEKSFFLWPIFHFEKRHLYTENPTDISMVFPLYISQTSNKRVQRTVLWPLFSYTWDQDARYTQWDFPWPFLRWAEGDEERSILRIFPLYGRKTWDKDRSGYILWPFYIYSNWEDEIHQKKIRRFLLLSKDQTEIWKDEGKSARTLRVWPFFYYGQRKEGSVLVQVPALIPLEDDGYYRNWAPLFTLYEYRRNARGSSESKFLWGFYTHRQNSLRELTELTFFLTSYKAEDVTYFSILKGLLEYRGQGASRAMRFLYSPWPVEWIKKPEGERAGQGGRETPKGKD